MKALSDKRLLLILDDISHEDLLIVESFLKPRLCLCAGIGSCVLFTIIVTPTASSMSFLESYQLECLVGAFLEHSIFKRCLVEG